MGRAIVRHPQVFLMDEPLSNLDAKLRVQTRTQIAALQQRLGITTVYVTHDQTEAMTMGDRVAVLHDGQLQQVASPRELYAQPVNTFVAGFVGSPAMNLLDVHVSEHGVRLGSTQIPVPRLTRDASSARNGHARVVLGIRPEGFELVSNSDPGAISLTTILVEELGADAYVYGETEAGIRLVVRVDGKRMPVKGEAISVRVHPDNCHLFSTDKGSRL